MDTNSTKETSTVKPTTTPVGGNTLQRSSCSSGGKCDSPILRGRRGRSESATVTKSSSPHIRFDRLPEKEKEQDGDERLARGEIMEAIMDKRNPGTSTGGDLSFDVADDFEQVSESVSTTHASTRAVSRHEEPKSSSSASSSATPIRNSTLNGERSSDT